MNGENRVRLAFCRPSYDTTCPLPGVNTATCTGSKPFEAWHGHYNQNANKYTAEIELQSATKLVRTKALALEAGEWRTTISPTRKSANVGARMATTAGDQRLRENKEGLLQSVATLEGNIEDGRQWAESVSRRACGLPRLFFRGLTEACRLT